MNIKLICGAFLLAYPFIMKGVYNLHNVLHSSKHVLPFDSPNPTKSIPYKDAECYLKLLNEINRDHFNAHPLWSHRGYDSDCNVVEYARAQGFKNEQEATLRDGFIAAEGVGSLAYLAFSIFKDGTTFGSVGQLLVLDWLGSMNMQYTLHYQHDMTHIVGNIVHHAGKVPGCVISQTDKCEVIQETGFGGAKLGNSIPHGVFPSLLVYEFLAAAVLYLAYKSAGGNSVPFMQYAVVQNLFALGKMRWQAAKHHPYLHKEGHSMFPWPLDVIIDDYNCHITQHHKDGTCLGVIDIKPLNQFYTQIMHFHGSLYQNGYVQRGTFAHEVVNVVSDYSLIAIMFFLFWGFFKVAGLFGGQQSVKSKLQ